MYPNRLNTRDHLREKLNGDVELYASGQPAYPSAIAFASGGTHTTANNMDVSQDSVKAPKAFQRMSTAEFLAIIPLDICGML
jgi:hypothetical protein